MARTPTGDPTAATRKRRGRFLRPIVAPRWAVGRPFIGPLWAMTSIGVLISVAGFLLGFAIYTAPNLSYIDGHSERQAVTSITTDGTCAIGRGSGHEYLIQLAPVTGDIGTGGLFHSCDSDSPAEVGGTLTVYVRSDGAQRLRINVNTVGDDIDDMLFVLVPFFGLGAVAAVVNVLSRRRKRNRKPPLTSTEQLIKGLRKDGSPRAMAIADDMAARVATGMPLSNSLTEPLLPPLPHDRPPGA